ncbi:MAG: glycerol-3-phosphate 1-O-acyltransferase PlsY [Firmicutes bacterium]|nr:glycerol-3-phosphate 1-O-acyltransferase PlsY [Bacillota bacterium]
MRIVLAVVLSYLLGGILFGELIGLISRVDVRKKGSGNPGATNVYRILGPLFGLIVLVGDTLKGVIGCLIGGWLGVPGIAPWCGLAVIAGHNWPLPFKFKGGKGIATSFGTIIVLAPATLLVLFPLWIVTLLLSGYVSLSSIVAALGLPLSCLFLYPGKTDLFFYALLACILAVARHRANIQRIMNGTENKILWKKPKEEHK